jgi:clathrin heavy chain
LRLRRIFRTTSNSANGGIIAINRGGQVLSVTIDEENFISYIAQTLHHTEMAVRLANKHDLPGADQMIGQQFDQLFGAARYADCATLVHGSNRMRADPNIMARFTSAMVTPGQPAPVLLYLQGLLSKGKLNAIESLELGRQVMQQNKVQLLQQWLEQDKLECSVELGDLVKPVNPQLGLRIYLLGHCHDQVIMGLVENGSSEKVMAYVQKVDYQPDWGSVISACIRINPQAAQQLASTVVSAGVQVDNMGIVEAFVQMQMVEQATAFGLDALQGESSEEKGPLQTRLLEVNLMMGNLKVADTILGQEIFRHYDKARIASLCEQQGLIERSLQHYTELEDIKRCVCNTHRISDPNFLLTWFGTLPPDWAMECLKELLISNMRQNSALVVQIATKYTEAIGAEKLIGLFETFKSMDGLFFYLGGVINFITDPDITFKYIEAAAKCNQFKEVERMTRENENYDALKVKDFLKEAKLDDPRPLINVCDKHGFVDELVKYFHANNKMKFIEQYALKVNPNNVPVVAGTLMDLDTNEDFIKSLILAAGNYCPAEPLVAAIEQRNRLKIILPWLEARVNEGSQDPVVHSAIAKVYVDSNNNPEHFLKTNPYYDSLSVGKYCEKRDPQLCVLAFTRGQCDEELIDVTSRYQLFKAQAQYLVERADIDLWTTVLTDNEHRRQLIDQVVSTALPNCDDAEKVSLTVQAFMNNDLPNELIELLDKIVLQSSKFSNEKSLQNLLILTAIKADPDRVMEYINRLDNFDAKDVADIAVNDGLFEEAFALYKKEKENELAIAVLLDNLQSIPRATEFAQRCDDAAVWTLLAKGQLSAVMVSEAVDSFCKANDPSTFAEVISVAKQNDAYGPLVTYLQMARKKTKDQEIDTELIYAFCKTERLSELEEFIAGPNIAQVQQVGDRCFDETLYEAAKLLYNNISNYARLSTTLSKLNDFNAAVDAARKANSTRTWREVCQACVAAEQFRLAQVCGLHIIVEPNELEDLIVFYEELGHIEELISLLEAGVGLERSHAGIFTELGALYAKYKEDRLFEHIKVFWMRINIPKLIRVTEMTEHWEEQCFLYVKYDEYDNAALVMMNHIVAWTHQTFMDVVVKVANIENHYKAIDFYLSYKPMLLCELLSTLVNKVEHGRVVGQVRRKGQLPLVKTYLQQIQPFNLTAVNDALNELLIEENNWVEVHRACNCTCWHLCVCW